MQDKIKPQLSGLIYLFFVYGKHNVVFGATVNFEASFWQNAEDAGSFGPEYVASIIKALLI